MGLRFGGQPVNRLWRVKQNFLRDYWTLRFNERLESCQIFFAYFVCLKKKHLWGGGHIDLEGVSLPSLSRRINK